MAYSLVHWAHVLVMGYWLGSELVINALTHYVTRADSLPGAERMKLWDFVLDVDQHVRNAMIMSVPLGLSLAAWMGLSPLTGCSAWVGEDAGALTRTGRGRAAGSRWRQGRRYRRGCRRNRPH